MIPYDNGQYHLTVTLRVRKPGKMVVAQRGQQDNIETDEGAAGAFAELVQQYPQAFQR
jgi:hypothetical protein